MPITKSAKKAMRQQYARTERNKGIKTVVKTFMKKVLELSKDDPENAKKLLPKAYNVIDTAAKKNIIHPNNADRKKSRLARAVSAGEERALAKGETATKTQKGGGDVKKEAGAKA